MLSARERSVVRRWPRQNPNTAGAMLATLAVAIVAELLEAVIDLTDKKTTRGDANTRAAIAYLSSTIRDDVWNARPRAVR